MFWRYLTVETRSTGEYVDPKTGRWFPLDKLGREGWELVSTYVETYQIDKQQMKATRMISTFKRVTGGYQS